MTFSLISRNPNIQSGAYCIRGTRCPVRSIKTEYQGGDRIESLMKDRSLTREQVLAALRFRSSDDLR